ncbi:hypothetical protein SAMN05421639_102361 [Chryseobacterium shigense]|uniref:Uncharacterized protein n=1 Tax=Chryseobacterium shigense TaxID=297244 RepID=A0A1N7I6N5_9FLAO|nr:hypothetical protein SAMN05421639_102361 [Chryseobacterium shigense]
MYPFINHLIKPDTTMNINYNTRDYSVVTLLYCYIVTLILWIGDNQRRRNIRQPKALTVDQIFPAFAADQHQIL